MLATAGKYSKFAIPQTVTVDIPETVGRYGRLVTSVDAEGALILRSIDQAVLMAVSGPSASRPLLSVTRRRTLPGRTWAPRQLKQELVKLGWPAEDLAGTRPARRIRSPS